MRVSSLQRFVRRGLLCLAALSSFAAASSAQTIVTGMALPTMPPAALDMGAVPSTQKVVVTLYLAPGADRLAALDSFLVAVQTPNSPQYHQWLTPASFAQSFGADAGQIAAVTSWAAQQGLSVDAVSASGSSITVEGTAAQMEGALAPGLHAIQLNGQRYTANTAMPTLPAAVAARVTAIDGLSTLPDLRPATLRTEAGRAGVDDLLAGVSALVEANSSRLLSISSAMCVEDVNTATAAAMHLLLKEAAAQGVTVLASSGCDGRVSASYPGSLAELVSVAAAPGITPATAPALTEVRPDWQSASGLPQDGLRREPDVTVSSLADLEGAVLTLLAKAPAAADGSVARLGNMGGGLYALRALPNLFTQADGATAGTWEAPTGLGLTNLPLLIKSYAVGTATAQVTIVPVSNTGGGNLYSISYGDNETYMITVSGSQGTPTGGSVTVSLSPGGSSYSINIAYGQAIFQLYELAGGVPAGQKGTAYTVTATYNGDGVYRAGDAGSVNLFVSPLQLALSASAAGSSGPLTAGGSYVVTVNQTATSGTPTGTVTITPSPGTAQQISFSGNTETATFTATAAGTTYIHVTCAGAGSYVCYSTDTSIAVGKGTPTLSTVQVAAVVANQPTTLSLTVTSAVSATPPTGDIVFTDAKNNTLCTTPYSNALSGTVSCQTSSLNGTTSGTVTATYAGDSNYNSTTSTGSYAGTAVTTTVSLKADKSGVVANGTVTLTAVITPATALNNTPLTGTVTFYAGTTQLGAAQSLTAYSPTVTYAVTLPTQGTQSITAVYSGDTNYAKQTSNAVSVLVGPATSVSFTANPTGNLTYGTPVTFTATLTGTPTDGTNALSGSLTFNIYGSTTMSVANVTLTPTAGSTTMATASAMETMALAAGTYKVQVACTLSNFDCSSLQNAGNYNFNITPETPAVSLALNPNTLAGGTYVTATATVKPASTATDTGVSITGTVTFFDNGTNVGTIGLNNNQASQGFTLSSAGGDNIVAVYNGDNNNASVTTIGGGGSTTATTTTVSANQTKVLSGTSVTLTAVVVAMPSSGSTTVGNPTGTVNFYDNNNGAQFLLGSAALVAGMTNTASAVLSTTALRDGANTISATFQGSSGYVTSSTTTSVVVQITDYTVTLTPTTLSLTAGQSGTATAAVSAVNGFTGNVTLTCTAPAGTAIGCSFDTPVVPTQGLATLTVTTTTRTAAVVSHGVVEAEAGAAGALLLCVLLPAARRRRVRLLAVAAVAVLGCTLGCTNLVNAPTGSGLGSGTPAGTQVLTITASGTDGISTVRHTYTLSVNVQ